MTNEEAKRWLEDYRINAIYAHTVNPTDAPDSWKEAAQRRDTACRTILAYLTSIPSGEPPQPRCPKCGSTSFDVRGGAAYCNDKRLLIGCNYRGETSTFFGPSAPQPQPILPGVRCTNCGMYGFYVRYDESLGGLVLKCVDCGEQKLIEKEPSAPSGSAGQEPRYTDAESTIALINWRAGMREAVQLIESVCQGTDYEHSKKYAELIRKRVARTEGEPEGRAESELECYCEDGETCETCKPSTPESVVSASPASARNVAIYGSERGGWPCQVCGYGHVANTDCPAAQPVAANPKVKEIAKEIIALESVAHVHQGVIEDIAAILGPFFTQVSQPPTDEVIRLRGLLKLADELHSGHTGSCSNASPCHNCTIHAQISAELRAAPVTPVSQNLGGNTMIHEVAADKLTRGDWRVEAINQAGEGECFVTIFSGPDAENRAKEYATWKNR